MKSSTEREPGPGLELLSYALPAIVSMVLSAGIVVVDGLFIGRSEGSAGLAAVNLTLPIFYVFLGTAIMIGVGGSVITSRMRGAGRLDEAHQLFSGTLVLLSVSIGTLLIILNLFYNPLLIFLTRNAPRLHQGLDAYLGTLRWYYPIMMVNLCVSIFIRSEGRPALSMVLGLAGNLLNAFLDYLLIFRMGMGLRGAALASGLASLLPLILAAAYFLSGRSVFQLARPVLKRRTAAGIFYNGSSEMVSQLSAAFSTWLFNLVILKYMGVDGLAAYTIVGYLIFIQGMVVIGLATGLGPLVSYHWGGGRITRLLRILRIGLSAAFALGLAAWICVILGGEQFAMKISGGNEGVRALATRGYRIFTLSFLLNGFNILVSTFFTALGESGISALISALRGLVFNCVFLLLFPQLWGKEGIWLTLPGAELATLLFAGALLYEQCVHMLREEKSSPGGRGLRYLFFILKKS